MITFVVTAFLLIFFWQSVALFILNTLLPWLVKVAGPIMASVFKEIVSFLNKAVKWTRLQMKKAWAWLLTRLKSMKSVYRFPAPNKCTRVTTTYIVTDEGNVIENVTEEYLDWYEMPSDVRKEFLKLNSDHVIIDEKYGVIQPVYIETVKKTDPELATELQSQSSADTLNILQN